MPVYVMIVAGMDGENVVVCQHTILMAYELAPLYLPCACLDGTTRTPTWDILPILPTCPGRYARTAHALHTTTVR